MKFELCDYFSPWLMPWIKECKNIISDAYFIRWKIYEHKSPLLFLVRIFLAFIKCISLYTIFTSYLKICIDYNKYKESLVEIYVGFWFIIELIFLFYIINIEWLILLFFIWRLSDIFQSCINIVILSEDPLPYSKQRMIILLLINIFEVVIIYGTFYYINREIFAIDSKGESIFQSVMTLTTIGAKFYPQNSLIGYSLVCSQIIFSILFLIVVIQRAISLFKN